MDHNGKPKCCLPPDAKPLVNQGRPLNCWEATRCGREPGGVHSAALGICPAALADRHDGLNHGVNGGRYCWRVAGTLCGGQVRGTFAHKLANCAYCEFFGSVLQEEGSTYEP